MFTTPSACTSGLPATIIFSISRPIFGKAACTVHLVRFNTLLWRSLGLIYNWKQPPRTGRAERVGPNLLIGVRGRCGPEGSRGAGGRAARTGFSRAHRLVAARCRAPSTRRVSLLWLSRSQRVCGWTASFLFSQRGIRVPWLTSDHLSHRPARGVFKAPAADQTQRAFYAGCPLTVFVTDG